ncbi:hypothetical protein JCM8547_005586 [Rhodosporidiobolus lusitaniae]
MTGRPRRSTAANTSYTALFAPLDLGDSSSSSSSSGDEQPLQAGPSSTAAAGGGGAPPVKRVSKKEKKRRATYIPSASSGSEFDAGAQSSPDEAEDDAEISEDGAGISSEGEGEGGGDSDVSGSVVSAASSGRGAGGSRGRGRGGRRGPISGRGGRAGGGRHNGEVVFAPSASSSAARPGREVPPRATPDPKWPGSGWDVQYIGTGPLVTTVPNVVLSGGKKGEGIADGEPEVSHAGGAAAPASVKGKGKSKVEEKETKPVGLSDLETSIMLEGWTASPFSGPSRGSLRDLGWAKGRWVRSEAAEGEERFEENERWGGWYEDLPSSTTFETVDEGNLFRYLPVPLPTLHQPQDRYTISHPDASSCSSADPSAAADTLEEETPAPTPSLAADGGSAYPDATGGPSRPARSADGAVTLLVGRGLGGKDSGKGKGKERAMDEDGAAEEAENAEHGERKVTLVRFDAMRIDSYIPRKPGHILNAGGPVSSVAWGPRGSSGAGEGGVRKEYLAVSTLSVLETPLKHTPLSSSTSPSSLFDTLRSSPAWDGHVPSPSSSSSTAAAGAEDDPSLFLPTPPTRGSMLQIWSLSLPSPPSAEFAPETSALAAEGAMDVDGAEQDKEEDRVMKLEMALCVKEGREGDALDVQWCPLGGSGRSSSEGKGMEVDGEDEDEGKKGGRLGLLAAVYKDGSVAVWEVPRPERVREEKGLGEEEVVYVAARPLLSLRLPNAALFSLAWGSHETLAAGGSNGWIGVWNVGKALREGKGGERAPPPRPMHYFPAHSSVIRSLVFVSAPPPFLSSVAAAAQHDHTAEPTGLVSTGYDGSTVLSDLRHVGGMGGASVLNHERTPCYAVAFSAHAGGVIIPDQDDRVKLLYLKASELGGSKKIAPHRGPITSIATSPHHAFVLSTSIDGSCLLTTAVRALRRRRVKGHFTQKLFRVEANRKTGEIRVWDNLDIEYRQANDPLNVHVLQQKSRKGGKNAKAPNLSSLLADAELNESDLHSAAWPVEQGVMKAAWHPAIERAGLCATGWACGIVRVDWCEGDER